MSEDWARIEARTGAGMMAAVTLAGTSPSAADVVKLADSFLPWVLSGPLRGRVSSLTYEQGTSQSVPTQVTVREDGTVMATMKDTQQYTITLDPKDSKGFDTTDAGITWTEDSAGAVVTLQVADDSLSALVVAVAPGTANIKASDGTREFDGSATVTPGDVVTLVGAEGAVEDQPAAPVTSAPGTSTPGA